MAVRTISLLKYLELPWHVARGYLRTDLETLETAWNSEVGGTPGGSGGSGGSSATPLTSFNDIAAQVATRVSLRI